MTHRPISALFATVAIVAAAGPVSSNVQPSTSEGPLTKQQVEEGLKVLTPRRVAGLIRERGTTFILDAEGERRLRNATSADPALLEEIVRLLAPPRSPSAGLEWIAPTDRRRMVWIPAGAFQMGSPATESARESDEALHEATVANGFWMESTEVTYGAFQKFVLANPEWQKSRIDRGLHDGNYLVDWKGNDFPAGKGEMPVVSVSWYAARAYAMWADKRLPTEAQWEYACRAGKRSAYWWGDTFDPVHAGAGPAPGVARNPWGLSSMLGGVWEWTSSVYRNYPFADDGRNDATTRGDRVIRGGSAASGPPMLRSANRSRAGPETCNELLGFRCAL
jgi:formylglycine-generating enzyme required for sulfatase activity